MVCTCWFFVAVMGFMWVPGFGSTCSDLSICNNLSDEDRILDCVHLCMMQTKLQQQIDEEDKNLLFSIILNSLISKSKTSKDKDVKSHKDERRSYSMEHFRWGKPPGRKRRPVKVFASSLEGDSSEGSFTYRPRRHLNRNLNKAKRSIQQAGSKNDGLLRSRVNSRSHSQVSQQNRKEGTYRMTHFRWGSPPVSKRNRSFMKTWEEKPQGPLAKFFKNIIIKDVQRIME